MLVKRRSLPSLRNWQSLAKIPREFFSQYSLRLYHACIDPNQFMRKRQVGCSKDRPHNLCVWTQFGGPDAVVVEVMFPRRRLTLLMDGNIRSWIAPPIDYVVKPD